MKIKTKILIIIISSVMAIAAISMLIYIATQRVEKEWLEAANTDELAREISELNVFVQEYAHHHEERPLIQARVKLDSILKRLKRENYEYPEEQVILEKIRQNYERVASDFALMSGLNEKPGPDKQKSAMTPELKQRLESSILFGSQEMISDAFQLAKMIREEEERYHERVHRLIFIVLAVVFAGAVALSFVLIKSITIPLTMLHKGTEIIGSGNLDHRTNIRTQDEIGQLSRAFDVMTEHIQGSYEALKESEEKLKEYSENLEKLVTARTQELERSNKELEQFAYIASHDLQEPARTVSSFVQLLAKRYKGALDHDAADFINYAVEGADRMQRMVTDLLAYSRVGTKGKPFAEVDCNSIINQVLSGLKVQIEENKAEVSLPAGPLPVIMADETQILQLFQNLVSNAIKFRGSEPPRIEIAAKRENGWLFAVKDNSIGFEQQYAEKIFDIFRRLHPIGKYAGSGIGLAVCRRIVEQHGGRIWAESAPGKGTVFFFTIPEVAHEHQTH